MAKVIFLAGMRGVGKSTLLETFADRFTTIDAEKLQSQAIKIKKCDENYPHPYDWREWEELSSDEMENLNSCLKTAFSKFYPKPTDRPLYLLIAGALVAKKYFRDSLTNAIKEEFSIKDIDQEIYAFQLNEGIISEQIRKRVREDEKSFVGNYEKIKSERDGYLSICCREKDSKLMIIKSHKEIRQQLESLLSPSTKI